jgi:excinuclease ABC subunit C
VFTDGQADKAEYRRFKIKAHENKPDDYAMLREVIARRLKEGLAGNPRFTRLPDLLLVDGGKGQLASGIAAVLAAGFTVQGSSSLDSEAGRLQQTSAAVAAEEPGIADLTTISQGPSTIPVASLAKRFEHLYVPGEPDPVILARSSQALYLVQRIRDEAHRFANAYRVQLQSKKQTRSSLDTIPGIGPTRRKALLKHFGSIEKMRTASLEELLAAPKMNRPSAETVYAFLQQSR